MRQRNNRGSFWGLLAVVLVIGCGSSGNSSSGTTDKSVDQPPAATAPQQTRAAAFIEQTVPAQMIADHDYTVSVRMRNTGKESWSSADSYRIGSVNPLDNEVWGLKRVSVPIVVAPGNEVTFTFALKAPRMPGEYNFQWRMVQDGVEWFGESTPNVPVVVATANQ